MDMKKTPAFCFKEKLVLSSLIAFFSIVRIFAQAPVVTSFSPSTGPVGTAVTITGTGFAPAAANNIVFFGATMAKVTAASPTSLTVTAPAGATYQPISVLNGNTALIAYSATPFVTTFTPGKGAITKDDFMPPVAFNTGGGGAIVIGDLDGDGKPDIAMANSYDKTVSVLRNTSTSGSITAGSFAPKVDFPVNVTPTFIAIADLDGDGKLDLVVTSEANSNNTISVLRNTSIPGSITASSFASEVDFAAFAIPSAIAIGDLDGDGRLDIAVSNGYTGGISIWRNISTPGAITAGFLRRGLTLLIRPSRTPSILSGSQSGTLTVMVNRKLLWVMTWIVRYLLVQYFNYRFYQRLLVCTR